MALALQEVAPTRDVVFMPPKGRWMVFLDPPQETLGQIIRRNRLAKGLTQTQLAEGIGLSDEHQALLSAYERGSVPPEDVLRAMERFFGMREGELDGPALRAVQSRRKPAARPELKQRVIAIPDEPGMAEVIEEVIELDPDKFEKAVEALRRIRSGEEIANDLPALSQALHSLLREGPEPLPEKKISETVEVVDAFLSRMERHKN